MLTLNCKNLFNNSKHTKNIKLSFSGILMSKFQKFSTKFTTTSIPKFSQPSLTKFSKFNFSSLFKKSPHQKVSNFYPVQKKSFSTPTFEDFMKNFEANMKESQKLASELLNELKTMNEEKIFTCVEKLNKLGMRLNHLEEIKNLITKDIAKFPLTKPSSLVLFFQFIDKLEIENIEEEFLKILPKYNSMTEKGKFSTQELVMVVYAYSKYQIIDRKIWEIFYRELEGKIQTLQLENITQLLLAFAMAQSLASSKNETFLDEEKLSKIYKELFASIDAKCQNLTYLDTFRICISMTKRPVNLTEIPQNTWNCLQLNFIKEINAFEIYHMSQILLLLCETP